MPYRRLPNTDAARIRAMRIAYQKGKELPPFDLAFSAESFVRLQAFLPSFENISNLQRQSMTTQVKSNKDYQMVVKRAKIYITHFLRVMNMAVQRGDFRKDTPEFFGLVNGNSSPPSVNTEKEIMIWGERIIDGEAKRLRAGRTPVTNPTIAVVRVHYERFMDGFQYQKTLERRTSEYSSQIAEMRKEADSIIVDIWNSVEQTFADLPEESRREKASEYGIVYVFRKGELEKMNSSKNQDVTVS